MQNPEKEEGELQLWGERQIPRIYLDQIFYQRDAWESGERAQTNQDDQRTSQIEGRIDPAEEAHEKEDFIHVNLNGL